MRLTHETLPVATTFDFRISVSGAGPAKAHENTLVRIEHETLVIPDLERLEEMAIR